MNRLSLNGRLLGALLLTSSILPCRLHGQAQAADTALVQEWMSRGRAYYASSRFDSAITCFEKALPIARSLQSPDSQLVCINRIAAILVQTGKNLQALPFLAEGVSIISRRATPSDLESANTYNLLGYVDAYLDKADSSIASTKKALEIRRGILGSDDPHVAASLYTLGLGYQKKGAYKDALECLHQALRIQRVNASQNSYYAVGTMLAIGSVYSALCEYDSALSYFEHSEQILESAGMERSSAFHACLNYTADVFLEEGRIREARAAGERALQLSRDLYGEDLGATAGSYAKLGEISIASGDIDRGIELLQHSLALGPKAHGENHSGTAWIYRRLSRAYERKDDLGRAGEYATKALEVQRASLGHDHPDVAYSLENTSRIEMQQQKYPSALANLKEAIAIRERSESGALGIDVARLYRKLGQLYTQMNRNTEALAALQRSEKIQNTLSVQNPLQEAAMLRAFGELYTRDGKFYLALQSYQHSIAVLCPGYGDIAIGSNPVNDECLDPNSLLESLVGKADILAKLSSAGSGEVRYLAASLSTLLAASTVADRTRKTYATEGSKIALEDRTRSIYEDGIRASLRLLKITGNPAYKEAAFTFAERSKANALLDGIRECEAKSFAGIPDSLIEREGRLRSDMTFCEAQIAREPEKSDDRGATARASMEKRLFILKESFRQLLREFEQNYPAFYAMRYGSKDVTVASVQAVLDDATCIVEYMVGEQSLYIFTISKTGFEVSTFPKPARLEDLGRKFVTSIRTIDSKQYLQTSPALYDAILRPIARQFNGKSRLIIVPDGPLYYVPFEALLSQRARQEPENGNRTDFTSLSYLVRQYEISYSFSSTFYLSSVEKGAGGRQTEAGFAGFAPVFRDSVKNGHLLASRGPEAGEALASFRSVTVDGKRFHELPYSENEVQSIVTDFRKNGTKSVGFFNADASEGAFKQEVGKYTYVHIATHGLINEDQPRLSALLFSQPRDSTSTEDGILYAGEAYGLNLNADLLVLSSCESGMGKLVRGEGLMAMTRGFFYAGARNIVFSLWKVYDDATNRLMVGFYDNVIDGRTYTSSLRQAKLKMIADPSTAFPGKWGAFVLVGE